MATACAPYVGTSDKSFARAMADAARRPTPRAVRRVSEEAKCGSFWVSIWLQWSVNVAKWVGHTDLMYKETWAKMSKTPSMAPQSRPSRSFLSSAH